MPYNNDGLSNLQNIGKVLENRLNEIGIFNRNDLVKIGPVKAYKKMQERTPNKSLPVCYYLYSLQGAIDGIHWDVLPEAIKDELSKELDF